MKRYNLEAPPAESRGLNLGSMVESEDGPWVRYKEGV